jgi:aspartate aminotransferase
MQPATQPTIQLAERAERISLSPTGAVLIAAERLRARGIDVVNFGVGEPDFPTPEHIKQAAVRALEQNFTKYTPTPGISPLREAICQWHRREFGTDYQLPESVITVGGKQALFNALSMLVNHGDEVILPAPYWVSFPDMIRYAGGEARIVHTNAGDGFRLRAAQVEALVTPRTKVLLVNSPNNPTGAVVPDEEFGRMLELCQRHNIWLLTDECYSHLLFGDLKPFSVAALPGAKGNVIVAGSFSKTFAMTGWRVGFALGPKPIIDAMIRLQSQSTTNATSISQYAALAAATGPMDCVQAMRSEYEQRRAVVLEGLAAIPGVVCSPPEGAFYAFLNVEQTPRVRALRARNEVADTARLVVDLLEEGHVAAVHGEAFGAPGYLRISFANSLERIREGLSRMKAFLSA